MNDSFLQSLQDTIVGEEYLTTPYDYILHQSWWYENIKNQFLPVTTLLELQRTLPRYANTLLQVFTIPIKIKDNNGEKFIDIEAEYILQITKKTQKDIWKLLSPIPTNIDILKWDIYKLIEDFKKYCIDEKMRGKVSIDISIRSDDTEIIRYHE